MITRDQCRAARALLEWTQQDLADFCGLSKTAINNFERGTTGIKGESLQAIQNAFEKAEIEFVGEYGVHKLVDTVRLLKGDDALPRLWNDIFETLKDSGGEVLINNLDERRSHEAYPELLEQHLERLRQHGITERLLCCEGADFFLQPLEYHRCLPQDTYAYTMSSFVYGHKVALQLWQDAMIIIINSREASDAERERFEELWSRSESPA